MRSILLTILLVVASALAIAQYPIGLGVGTVSPTLHGLTNFLDWYVTTPVGCTAGANGNCTGTFPIGDTLYCTGWMPNASALPITGGLPVVCGLNDYKWSLACQGNLLLFQLDTFSWSTPAGSRGTLINCMSDYGTNGADTNTPAGWFGHLTSGDDGSQGGTWKSRNPISIGGNLIYPVYRQIAAGTAAIHDATFILSPDGGKHLCNPYTYANRAGGPGCDSSNWSANGDAPICGAANASIGSNCTNTAYLDASHSSMMWKALPATLYHWGPVIYGQDGTTLPVPKDGTDPTTYMYGMGEYEGSLMRIPIASIMDVSTAQYFTCPTGTSVLACPLSASASWTSTIANRSQLFPSWIWGITYLKEFGSYLATSASGFATAPDLRGPWTLVQNAASSSGAWGMTFMAPAPGLGYTVVSTNPPHIKLTTSSDYNYVHDAQSSPVFAEWDLTLGKTLTGAQPIYKNVGNGQSFYSGLSFAANNAVGTLPRKDLVWAFDFYDYSGAAVTSGFGGYADIGNNAGYLLPCSGSPASVCGFITGQGTSSQSWGFALADDGYAVGARLMTRQLPQTIASGITNSITYGLTPQSLPASLQGNQSFSVVGVYAIYATGFLQVPLWSLGDTSGSNTAVALSFPSSGGGPLELGWGISSFRWRFLSSFTPTLSNWYFIATTVTANGATPSAHMWTGVGGVLVDEIAGVTRASTGGSPTQTPNISSGGLTIGVDPTSGSTNANALYSNLEVYSRALSQAEVGQMYTTLKANLAKRGVSVQ